MPRNFAPVFEKYDPWYVNGKWRAAKQSSAKARQHYTPGLTGHVGRWVLDTVPSLKTGDTPTIPPLSAKPHIPRDNLTGVVASGPTTRVPPRNRPIKSKSQTSSNPHTVSRASRVPNRWVAPPPNTITSPNSNPLGDSHNCTGKTNPQDTQHPAVPRYTSLNFLGEPLVRSP